MSPIDYFICSYLKSLVYRTHVNDKDGGKDWIFEGCLTLQNTLGIFERVHHILRCEVLIKKAIAFKTFLFTKL